MSATHPEQPSILVADDHEASRISLGMLLRQQGYAVTEAAGGSDAVAILQKQPHDLLIADIRMEGNERLELVRAVAQLPAPPPVILVTGYPAVETAMDAVQLRVVAYLMKPLDHRTLLQYVRCALLSRRVWREIQAMQVALSDWSQQTAQLEEHLRLGPTDRAIDILEAHVNLVFQNTLLALGQLRTLTSSLLRCSAANAAPVVPAATPLLVIEALRDAIATLEKTKDAFHSRELAALRRRLQQLLSQAQSTAPALSPATPESVPG